MGTGGERRRYSLTQVQAGQLTREGAVHAPGKFQQIVGDLTLMVAASLTQNWLLYAKSRTPSKASFSAMMTGCTQYFQTCLGLSKSTSSCCFPAPAAEHGARELCKMQIVEGNAAHRALVPCAVTASPWTSETASGSVMPIAHPTLPVLLLKNCKVLVPQKILEITNIFYGILVPEFFSATAQ